MTREEAIKWLEETKFGGKILHDNTVIQVCDMAIAAIREQEERRWIPASEPPKDSEPVLVCTKHRKPFKARYSTEWKRWDVSGSVVITHWMPLPDPPVEG